MIRRPPRSTPLYSSAASDVYKRQRPFCQPSRTAPGVGIAAQCWEDAAMPDSDVREVLTWEMFGNASRELAQQVFDSGFQPDLILSIARGGLFAAGAVSYALGIKNLHVMNVEFYTDVE